MRDKFAGFAYMAGAAFVWGSIPLIVRWADAPAALLVALRMGIAAVALAPFALRHRDGRLRLKTLATLAGLGVLLALNWVLFFRAIQLVGATAVIINYAFPIFIAIVAPWTIGETREPLALPLAVIGLLGVATIVAPQATSGNFAGGLFAFGGAMLTATLMLAAKKFVATVPGVVIAFWQMAAGFIVLVPWVVLTSDFSRAPWAWGAVLGIVHTAATAIFFFRALARIPAQEAAILMYLEPVMAVVFVSVFLASGISLTDIAGGVLILGAGIALVTSSTRRAGMLTRARIAAEP